MKSDIMRWCLAVLMLLGMALFLSSPAVAEIRSIPLDMKACGAPDPRQGKKWDTEYEDESIQVQIFTADRKPKSSLTKITAHWAHIKIADPSQLRTTMSNESYDDETLAYPWKMAEKVNAIVACNGDFMKYKYNVGYVVKQGVFYRDALDGTRDILIIDDRGDFHVVIKATSDQMAEKIREMEAEGRQVVNTFSFGPVLVLDGEIQDTTMMEFESHIATQRIVIAQLGELEYAIIEVDGGDGSGMNMQELATYVTILYPDCKVAYNLDGGGSTQLIWHSSRLHKTPGCRPVSDIIYFASADYKD